MTHINKSIERIGEALAGREIGNKNIILNEEQVDALYDVHDFLKQVQSDAGGEIPEVDE